MVKFSKFQVHSFGALKKAANGSVGAFNKLSSVAKSARHVVNDITSLAETAGAIGAAVADTRTALTGLSMAGL